MQQRKQHRFHRKYRQEEVRTWPRECRTCGVEKSRDHFKTVNGRSCIECLETGRRVVRARMKAEENESIRRMCADAADLEREYRNRIS